MNHVPVKVALLLSFLFIAHTGNTQPDSIRSRGRFSNLNDGVYFSVEELQQNKPSVTKAQLVKPGADSLLSISSWSVTENLFYRKDGEQVKVNRDSLWGFVEKGTPFIYMRSRFHRMSTIGAICVFTETYPSEFTNSIVVTEVRGSSTQRIFDFEFGRVGDYDLDNVSSILSRDEELYKKFDSLKTEKQKTRMLYKFIEKYNDRHRFF